MLLYYTAGGEGLGWGVVARGSSQSSAAIDRLSVTSHTLPHAASGSYQVPGTTHSPPTTRHPVAQVPTTVKGDHKYMEIAKITEN